MGLVFLNNYAELNDKEIVNKIINKPYNEEAAAYLIYNRYDPLLHKLYREIYDKDPSWYEDCLGDLFGFLKGKEKDWNRFLSVVQTDKEGNRLNIIKVDGVDSADEKVIGKRLQE